ncbi:hypothetical protein Tco_1072578, partial [Tanacetum coccineum]
KRLGIALGLGYEVGESSSAAARPAGGLRADYGFVATIDKEIRRDPKREALIDQGVAAVMAEAEASRVRNGYNSNGTEGVVRLTRWFEKMSLCLVLAIAQHLVKSNLLLALYKTMLLHGGIPMLRPLLLKQLMLCHGQH